MVNAGFNRRRERLQNVVHWITVLVVAMKGVVKLEQSASKASVLFVAAAAIALGTFFHHALQHRFRHFDVFFFLVEAAVLFYVGWLYQLEQSRALHLVFYVSACLYVVAAVVYVSRRKQRLNVE